VDRLGAVGLSVHRPAEGKPHVLITIERLDRFGETSREILVVGIEESNDFASRFGDSQVTSWIWTRVVLSEAPDLISELVDLSTRPVRRPIVDDDHLSARIILLQS
jgi:hypothetical protein